jgi:hypothetical protein
MDQKQTQKIVLIISVVWMVLGLALLGILLAGLISKNLFLNIFAGGFVLYALVVTVVSRVLPGDP